MFERLETPADALKRQLAGALTMERDIVEMLDELIESSHDDDVKQALRQHQTETRGHVRNVEQVFGTFGWEVDDAPCPAIAAIEKEGKATIKKADDAIVDSVILEGAVETEHHEIAVYENLIIHAHALGRDDAVELLDRNREEEQAALEKVKELSRARSRPHAAQAS